MPVVRAQGPVGGERSGAGLVLHVGASRTIAPMHAPEPTSPAARHELVLAATLLVVLAAAVAASDAFIPAGLLPIAVLLAGLGILGREQPEASPYLSVLLPAMLTGGAAAVVHLVPTGVWLLAALAAYAIVMDRMVALETGILAQVSGLSDGDRARVIGTAVVTAFVVFTGVASLVPGGMPEPTGAPTAGSSAMTEGWLAVLALADAAAALVIGWRIAALRFGSLGEMARSALTYALVTAIAAGLIRAIDLPRLVGPAVLTLVFYLWDAQHGSAPARRRERRFLWEMILLAALAILVIAWNLRLQQ
jgi:hypothetical protein